MPDIIFDILNFRENRTVLNVTNEDGSGYGKFIDLEKSLTAEELAKHVKKLLGCETVRYLNNKSKITRAAICPGSGGSELHCAYEAKCDCLITGDIKHDVWIEAQNIGISLIDAGHFHTENVMCAFMKKKLNEKFPDLTITTYESNACRYIL